jgi:hypothetical protein
MAVLIEWAQLYEKGVSPWLGQFPSIVKGDPSKNHGLILAFESFFGEEVDLSEKGFGNQELMVCLLSENLIKALESVMGQKELFEGLALHDKMDSPGGMCVLVNSALRCSKQPVPTVLTPWVCKNQKEAQKKHESLLKLMLKVQVGNYYSQTEEVRGVYEVVWISKEEQRKMISQGDYFEQAVLTGFLKESYGGAEKRIKKAL